MSNDKEEVVGLSSSGLYADANESSLGLLPVSYLQDSTRNEESVSVWPSSTRVVPGLQASQTEPVSQTAEKPNEASHLLDGDDEISAFEIELDMDELNNLEADFSDFSEDNLQFSGNRNNSDNDRAGSSGSSVNDIGPRPGQGVGCAMESRSTSEADTEDEIRAVLGQDSSNAVTLLPRPGLEGQSSLDCLPRQGAMVERECAEGSIEVSPIPSGDGGGGGDGSSGHTSDSGTVLPSRQPVSSAETTPHPGSSNTTFARVGPLGNEDSTSINRSTRSDFTRDHTVLGFEAKDEDTGVRASGLRSHLLQPALNPMDDSYGIRPWGADESSLRIDNLAPRVLMNRSGDGSETGLALPTPPSQSSQVNFSDDQFSARSSSLGTAPSMAGKGCPVSSSTDIQMHQNIVDEEFGYCNPFDDDEIVGFDKMGLDDQEFFGSDKAKAMLNEDEKIFEEENKFRQDDPMSSLSLGTSWAQPPVVDLTRPSWMTEVDEAESRVSFGQFLRSKTAALGSLDDKESTERPHFGNKVITPPRSGQPVALIEVDSHRQDMSPETNLQSDKGSSFATTATVPKNSQFSMRDDPRQVADNSVVNETGVLSLSTISQMIAEASVSSDPQAMVDMIFKWSKQLHESKRRPSETVQPGIINKVHPKTHSLPLTSISRPPRAKDTKKAEDTNKQSVASTAGAQRNLCADPLDWKVIRPSSVVGYGNQIDKDRTPQVELETPVNWRTDESSMMNQKPVKRTYQTSTPFQTCQPLPFDFSPSLVTLHSAPGSPSRNVGTKPTRESLERGLDLQRGGVTRDNGTRVNTPPTHLTASLSSFPLRNQTPSHIAPSRSPSSPRGSPNSTVSQRTGSTIHAAAEDVNTATAFRPLEVDVTLTSDSKISQPSVIPTDVMTRTELYVSSSVTRPHSSVSTSRMSGTVSLQRAMALKLPEAVHFNEVVAVGIPTEAVLTLENPTAKWLQCSLEIDTLAINGKQYPPQMSPFQFKNTIIVEPSSKEELQIIFDSRIPGQVVASLKISTEVMTSNQHGMQDFPTASVLLHAEAEQPNIQVLLGKQQMLDFGILPEDSICEKSLGLVNVGLSTVPLRLVIHENSPTWQGFYFPKKNEKCCSPPPRQFESPRVLTCLLPGQSATSVPLKVVNFQIAFRAQGLEGTGESMLAVSSTLTLELDTKPVVGNILHTVPLKALIGKAQLETVKNIDPVRLQACPGTSVEQVVPLRNSGSIPLVLEMSVLHKPHLFNVCPHAMEMTPGEESAIVVSFAPREVMPVLNNALLITICPGGLIYELPIIADTYPAIPVPEDFSLESDKQLLVWPGVTVGEIASHEVALRNCSQTGSVQLHLQIHGTEVDFWLQIGPNLARETYLVIPQSSVRTITTVYRPQSFAHNTSKLTIKPLQVTHYVRSIRFVIPLLGYGGASKLELVEARQLGDAYCVDVGAVVCGTTTLYHLLIKNLGERAAFVKVLVGSAASCPLIPYAAEVIVSGNELVVERGKMVEVVVAIRSSIWNDGTRPPPPEACFGSLTIFYGDEVNRRRFRRLLQTGSSLPSLPSSHPLNGVNFDVLYDGEQLEEQEDDLPQTSYDYSSFFHGISSKRVWLITQRLQIPSKSKIKPTHLPAARLVNPSSPPVREVQPSWDVSPKELAITLVEGANILQSKTFSLVNSTSKPMSFQLMWPAHLLSVAPAEGSIPARKNVNVNVQPLPSKSLQINTPREATVVVKCGKQQQEVNVIILKTEKVDSQTPTKSLSPVKVACKEIVFPNTPVGQSSEFRMEMSNSSPLMQHWTLAPTSVGQFKQVKNEGSAPSLTYSVFRFAKMSGRLPPEQATDIPVTFLPLDYGDFAQSWDMISRDSNRRTHKICIELRGSSHPQLQAQSTKTSGRKVRHKLGSNSDRPICSPSNSVEFPVTRCHTTACQKIVLNNISTSTHVVSIKPPQPPFFLNHETLTLRERHYIRVPIHFKPDSPGTYCDTLTVNTNLGYQLLFEIRGEAEDKA